MRLRRADGVYRWHLGRCVPIYDALGQLVQWYGTSTDIDARKRNELRQQFLFDLDDGFYSASYLRAWAFEVSLREYLKTKFGSQWWASKRAGDFLKEIWETGDRYTADEMASQIGVGPISFELLIEEFNTILR